MDFPQTILKAIKSNAFDVAIDLISYFNQTIVVKMNKITFVDYLKEEVSKLTDTLKDKIKEAINLQISSKSTFELMTQLKSLMPISCDTLEMIEEYIKLRD